MSILEKATMKARGRKLGRLLNQYMLGEDSDFSKNRQKVIDFLQDDKAMAGLDVNEGTTDIASANCWLPLFKNDVEMTQLMISRGASLEGVYVAPLEDYNGKTMRWALFSMATDARVFQLLIKDAEPINTPVEDSGKTVLPLQILLGRYKKAKVEKEKYLETIMYLLQNGADVNLNASSEPSVVITIVQLDLPEIYELIPAGAIDKERKYLVEGHLLTLSCYEFLLGSKDIVKPENYAIHERNLKI